jgi:rhomboid protease GluP
MNMNALNSMSMLEAPHVLGRGRMAFIYLASGIAGSLASYKMCPNPSLGASGAILGAFGAAMMFAYDNEKALGPAAQRLRKSMQQSVALTLLLGLALPQIDNWCEFEPIKSLPAL